MAYPPFKLRRRFARTKVLSPIVASRDEVLVVTHNLKTGPAMDHGFRRMSIADQSVVRPEYDTLGDEKVVSVQWMLSHGFRPTTLVPHSVQRRYRHACILRLCTMEMAGSRAQESTKSLPRMFHPITYPHSATSSETVISGILKMTQNNFSVKTFDDLMSMRALTGVTRITEHHLVNRKTTKCFVHQWLIKGARLSDVHSIVDYFEAAKFFVELRHDDPLGPPESQSEDENISASMNAYNIDQNGLVKSLINVTVGDHLVVSVYQIAGEPDRIQEIGDLLSHRVVGKPIKLRYLSGFDGNGRPVIETRELDKELNRPLDCFYPAIDETIAELAAAFEQSNNNLLFMISEPGTGKSTLIRELCRHYTKRPLYQFAGDKVIGHPAFDLFLASLPANSVCIMEDAENLVGKRTEGNTTMALLLNEIDGIANKNIKFIISTNFENRKHVDEALFRPGRCFRTLEFGKLTREQGQRICDDMQIDRGAFLENNAKFTLAELLSDGGDAKVKDRAVGFKLG